MFKRVLLWKKHKGSIPSLGQGGHGAIGPARGQAAAIMRRGIIRCKSFHLNCFLIFQIAQMRRGRP